MEELQFKLEDFFPIYTKVDDDEIIDGSVVTHAGTRRGAQ